MKTKDFKELCAVYTANPNLDNENVLLRTMVFDLEYYVATVKYEKGNAIRMFQSETGATVLCVYTHNTEVDSEIKEKYDLVKMSFDDLYENVNANNVEYLLINPNTEALTLTSSQISKLYREKYYSESSFPLHLEKDSEIVARAIKISDLNSQFISKKLIDIYLTAANEKEEEKRATLLSEFLDEFMNRAKFYTPVVPSGEVDSVGNLIATKDRVVFITEDKIKGEYYLFVDSNKIIETLKVDPEKTYVSVFDFDDCVALMDAARNTIKGIKIIGDVTITIPAEDIYRYAATKEHDLLRKGVTVLKGSYAPSEETDLIEKDLDELFTKHTAIDKAWLGREIELYKNEKNAYIYNVVLKLTNDELNKEKIKNSVRKILGNKLHRMYIATDATMDSQLKLVYDKSTKPVVEEKTEEVKEITAKKAEAKPTAKKAASKTTTKKETAKKTTVKKAEVKPTAKKVATKTTTKKETAKKTTVKKVEAKPTAKKATAKAATEKKAESTKKQTTKKVEKK